MSVPLSKGSLRLISSKSTSISKFSFSASSNPQRLFTGVSDAKPPSVHLYQYKICPFCNKTKALFDYCGISYSTTEVNPLTKAELKPWSGDYRKVPIALIDEEQVNGSDEITAAFLRHPHVISSLEQKWKNTMDMNEFVHSDSAKEWTEFATRELATLLYPNICRTWSDSFQAFGYVQDVKTFSSVQKASIRFLGSFAMYIAASKIKSKRGITDEREALDKVLDKWEKEGLGDGKLFASGKDEPNLGDVTMFGTLRSVEGLPIHKEVTEERGGGIKAWYDGMKQQLDGTVGS